MFKTDQPRDGRGFFHFQGPFWKALEWWGKHQLWSWFAILLMLAIWVSYDLGSMIARSSMTSGLEGVVSGTISVQELEKKATELKGGRLIVTSQEEARYVDPTGRVWAIPHFAGQINREQFEAVKRAGVVVDGRASFGVAPVKTRPRDLVIATLTDVLMKLWFVAIYGLIAYVLLRHLGYGKKARFNRVTDADRGKVKLSDVAGMEGPKREVAEIVEYLRDPQRFDRLGARPPRGVLLSGPPGNGKTLLAKAIAGEADAAFLEQSGSSFIEIYVGAGAKSVRSLFAEARKLAPCLVFIDEIDAIGASRDAQGSHEERVQSINALLTEMDGFQENMGVVVIAATNRPEVLDAALVRPGRFDRTVHVPLPSRADREAILQVHARKLPSWEFDLPRWARRTSGLSGAQLAGLVNEAAVEAARRGKEKVDDECMIHARERILMGPRNMGQQHPERDRKIIAYHEVGHAVVQAATGGVVEKISILPRGRALGVTLTEATEDRLLLSEEDVRVQLRVLLGGRAAEKEFIGSITGGAADDLQKASALARQAVRWWALDGAPYAPEHSDLVLEQEKLAKEWVSRAYDEARALLAANASLVHLLATELLENDEIEGELFMGQLHGEGLLPAP